MFKNFWLWTWRLLLLGELVGMIGSGLVAAFSWQTLHVTALALYHHPNLLLDAGTVFVTASIASAVLLVAFFCTAPVLVLLEWFASRARRHNPSVVSEPLEVPSVYGGVRHIGGR